MIRARSYERVRRLVQSRDPRLIAAAAEVDQSLLDWALELSPLQRLQAVSDGLAFLSRFKRGAPKAR